MRTDEIEPSPLQEEFCSGQVSKHSPANNGIALDVLEKRSHVRIVSLSRLQSCGFEMRPVLR
jgi:hypothetical protein